MQVDDLTAKLERLTQEKDEQCKAKEAFFNGMNDIREQREALRREVAELTRRREEAQRNSVPIQYFKTVPDPEGVANGLMVQTHDGYFVPRTVADALQAKLEEAQARAQRPPEPHESVCHACDGSGWVSS